jgi:hypothetical protein
VFFSTSARPGGCLYHLRDETVAAPRFGDDEAALGPMLTKRLPERRHVDAQVRFLDDLPGPHPLEQLILGQQASPALDERREQVERFRLQSNRASVAQQLAPVHVERESIEAIDSRRKGGQVAIFGSIRKNSAPA